MIDFKILKINLLQTYIFFYYITTVYSKLAVCQSPVGKSVRSSQSAVGSFLTIEH
jgi:hypothetical protein